VNALILAVFSGYVTVRCRLRRVPVDVFHTNLESHVFSRCAKESEGLSTTNLHSLVTCHLAFLFLRMTICNSCTMYFSFAIRPSIPSTVPPRKQEPGLTQVAAKLLLLKLKLLRRRQAEQHAISGYSIFSSTYFLSDGPGCAQPHHPTRSLAVLTLTLHDFSFRKTQHPTDMSGQQFWS
jgi:hypothetical protein